MFRRVSRSLVAQSRGAALVALFAVPTVPQSAPAIPRLLVYPGDLTIVEEIAPVVLSQGRSTVRLDFVRGNADVASLEVVPLDRAGEVKVASLFRRDDLGNTTFVELDAAKPGPERLRLRYAARGLSAGIAYTATFDAAKWTLDLVQELEISNGSGESFAQADVRAVFGVPRTVASSAVLHGRAPDPAPDAAPGLSTPPLQQDLAEHTVVAFGAPLVLPDGVTVRRRALDRRELPTTLEWRFDIGAWGGRVWRVAKVANAANSGLGGITLQPGSLFLVEREATATERFVRGGSLGPIAPGQELELDLGPTNDLAVERTVIDLQRGDLVFGDYNKALVSYSETESMKLVLESRAADVRTLTVTEHVATASFEVTASSAPATRKDQTTLEWKVEVPAGGKVELTYTVKKTNLHP
ncbi:MAG: hypothetical protein EXS13_09815 [Planctomycetes bacterium]|nr:hypothetical protein [Planctomycetota bacterium]